MPKVYRSLDFTPAQPKELHGYAMMVRKIYEFLARIVNGRLSFGDGTNRDNIDGNWVSTTTPAAPNTDFTLTHNLGRIPVGYIVAKHDRAVDVYTGSISWTTTTITLRASVASAVVNLFIF